MGQLGGKTMMAESELTFTRHIRGPSLIVTATLQGRYHTIPFYRCRMDPTGQTAARLPQSLEQETRNKIATEVAVLRTSWDLSLQSCSLLPGDRFIPPALEHRIRRQLRTA